MNSIFAKAVETEMEIKADTTQTENGMKAYKTSDSKVLDLFSKIGAMRNTSDEMIVELFDDAYKEDPHLAVRVLLWARDARGGSGERQTFRTLLKRLEQLSVPHACMVADKIPELGRFDDLFAFDVPQVQDYAMNIMAKSLIEGNKLAAKWCPREKSSKKEWATRLRKHLNLKPKEYRKLIAGNTEVVETLMCSNRWSEIVYQHVPSCAMNKYSDAFSNRDYTRFTEYLSKVESGEVKINANVLYPHTLANKLATKCDKTAELQWSSLPDYIKGRRNILPMCDVSGSMYGLPMDVSIGLGVYISERASESFKNVVMTFTDEPTLVRLKGSLKERIYQLHDIDWGYNTNLEKAFSELLKFAVRNKISSDDMPDTLLVISDMQFDEATDSEDTTAYEMIKSKYAEHGYKIPLIVFWNVDARNNIRQSSTKADDENVVEISGFSPAIMEDVLSGNIDDYTPYNMMIKVIGKSRYNF